MQHIATVGLGLDSVVLNGDQACDEILSFEMNPATVLRPAAGDEAAHGDGTAEHRNYETGVVARDLQAKELHGVCLPIMRRSCSAWCACKRRAGYAYSYSRENPRSGTCTFCTSTLSSMAIIRLEHYRAG